MTTDMKLAIVLVLPLALLCLRGEIRDWVNARRQTKKETAR